MARFSKTAVLMELAARQRIAAKQYLGETGRPIEADNGTAQVRGLSEAACVLYGEWRALAALDEAIHSGEVAA